MNYYNEFDPKTAAWLRELIKQGIIPNGDVDERSITEVSPGDLQSYTQCHFFAGIGGWSYALQLAGWPTDRPVWTGSCPCQPFSVAGKGRGTEDERHLWPVFAELIRQCQPPIVFGEQVASSAGREWLAGVFADLEEMAYQRAGADLCAAGVSAPHIRQRLFWVAYPQSQRRCWRQSCGERRFKESGRPSENGGMDDARCQRDELGGGVGYMGCATSKEQSQAPERQRSGNANSDPGADDRWRADSRLINCRDGKQRRIPTEPALFPLAHGIPARVASLRGAGNAIVPQVAAEFIQAAEEAIQDYYKPLLTPTASAAIKTDISA